MDILVRIAMPLQVTLNSMIIVALLLLVEYGIMFLLHVCPIISLVSVLCFSLESSFTFGETYS